MKRRLYGGRRVSRAVDIADLREMARRRLPGFVFEYLEGGADDEITLRRNRRAIADVAFVRHVLSDVSARDASGVIFGEKTGMPCAIGPTGFSGLLWRHADVLLARAAARHNIPFTLSTVSSDSLAAVAKAGGRLWFQLFMWSDPTIVGSLVERADQHGCEALVVTVDGIIGNRTWDKRNYARPLTLTLRAKIDVLLHLRWLLKVFLPRGLPGFGNLAEFLPPERRSPLDGARFAGAQVNPAATWEDLDRLRQRWPRKLIVKGLIAGEDVDRAARIGADAVVLSNHGGRLLDGDVSSIEALPGAVEAARGRLSVFVDGGFRRGGDVAKALALGADGVLLARATLYGVAAGGEEGACRALDIIREELDLTLGNLGCLSPAALGPAQIWGGRPDPAGWNRLTATSGTAAQTGARREWQPARARDCGAGPEVADTPGETKKGPEARSPRP